MRKFAFVLSIFLFSCCNDSAEFIKTESGLEYCFVLKNDTSKTSDPGDVWILNLNYYNSKDSLLFSSSDVAQNFKMLAPDEPVLGSIEEGLFMMHEGDSAIFKVDAKNFYEKSRKISVPDFIKFGEKLTFHVKMTNIIPSAEYKKQIDDWIESSEAQESLMIHDYINREGLNATKLEPGIYKVLTTPGSGKKITGSESVTVNYIGYFIDGREFDNTYKCNKPFTFQLNAHKTVTGFENGILSMTKGEKAIFIIPSKFAYGPSGVKGSIPGFATLIFDVELLDFK